MSHRDPEVRRQYARAYYQKNREVAIARSKEYRESNKEKISAARKITSKKYRVEKDYEISIEEYYKCMATSDICELCGTTDNLCYDHDHETMEFRGVLCSKCNRQLVSTRAKWEKQKEYMGRFYK